MPQLLYARSLVRAFAAMHAEEREHARDDAGAGTHAAVEAAHAAVADAAHAGAYAKAYAGVYAGDFGGIHAGAYAGAYAENLAGTHVAMVGPRLRGQPG